MTERITPSRVRFALATLLVLVALLVVWWGSSLTPDRAAELAADAGAAAWIAFILAFAFIQPLGISGHVFVLAAVVLWPPWTAFFLGLTGAVAAAVVSFVIARYVAHDAIQKRLPERARRYEQRLVDGGVLGVVVVRLLTFTAHPFMYLMGVSRVRFSPMLVGTIVGFIPAVAIDVLVGKGLLALIFG